MKSKSTKQKVIRLCLMCGKIHKVKYPELCVVMYEVYYAYLEALGPKEAWRLEAGIKAGVVDIKAEAKDWIKNRKSS